MESIHRNSSKELEINKEERFEKLLFLFGANAIINLAQALYEFAVYVNLKGSEEFKDLPVELLTKIEGFAPYVFCYEEPKDLCSAIEIINAVFYGEVKECQKKPKRYYLDVLLKLLKLL